MTTSTHTGRMLCVNLPVADLERSKAFFAKLGFSYNPMFTDDKTAACMLVGEQAIVMREMQKATPLARHLTAYFLRSDVGLPAQFKEELEAYLRGIAGALELPVTRIEINIPTEDVKIPPRPELSLCEGSVALANGFGFARRQQDGSVIGIYPRKTPPAGNPSRACSRRSSGAIRSRSSTGSCA